MLTNNDYRNLLDFSLKLTNEEVIGSSKKLEKEILRLIHEKFNFSHSVFSKYNNFILKPELKNIFGYNFDSEMLNEFKKDFVQKDIFISYKYWNEVMKNKFLNNLKNKKVLLIEDVCSLEQYEKSEYGKFISKANVYYQSNLVLNDKGDVVSIFKKKEEGDFTSYQRVLLEEIVDIISNKYNILKKTEHFKHKISMLKCSTENMPFGLVVFDEYYNILEYNKLGIEYCGNITNQYGFNDIVKNFKRDIYKIIKQEEDNEESKYVFNSMKYTYRVIKGYMVLISSNYKSISDNNFRKDIMIYIYNINLMRKTNEINKFVNTYKLTKREIEVSKLICEGLSNKEIAEELFISSHTVKSHIDNIFRKLEVNNRVSVISKLNILLI